MSATVEIIFEGLALAVLSLSGATPDNPPDPVPWVDVLLPATANQEGAEGESVSRHHPRLIFTLESLKSANVTLDVHLTPLGERVVEVDLADTVVVFETAESTPRQVTLESDDSTVFQSAEHLLDLSEVGVEAVAHDGLADRPPAGSATRIELPAGTLRSTHVILNPASGAPQRFNYPLQGGGHAPSFTVAEGFRLKTEEVQSLKIAVSSTSRSEVYSFSLEQDLSISVSHFPSRTKVEEATSSKRIEHVELYKPVVSSFASGAPALRIPSTNDGTLSITDGWCPSGRVWQ